MNYLRMHLHFLKLDRKEEHDLLLALLTVLKGKTTVGEILQDVHSVGPSVVLYWSMNQCPFERDENTAEVILAFCILSWKLFLPRSTFCC